MACALPQMHDECSNENDQQGHTERMRVEPATKPPRLTGHGASGWRRCRAWSSSSGASVSGSFDPAEPLHKIGCEKHVCPFLQKLTIPLLEHAFEKFARSKESGERSIGKAMHQSILLVGKIPRDRLADEAPQENAKIRRPADRCRGEISFIHPTNSARRMRQSQAWFPWSLSDAEI